MLVALPGLESTYEGLKHRLYESIRPDVEHLKFPGVGYFLSKTTILEECKFYEMRDIYKF